MPDPRYPALYQVNTRVWLTGLSCVLARRASLCASISDFWCFDLPTYGVRFYEHTLLGELLVATS